MTNKKIFSFQKLIRGALLVILILSSSITTHSVNAQTLSDKSSKATFSLKDLGFTSDDEYQGVLVSRNYDIHLPQTWSYEEPVALTIHFSHSPSLNSHSVMAVDWNGMRVDSVLLSSSNSEDGTLTVTIPANLMATGYNKLTIQFYMGIRDDFCEDFDNPALWAVVHNTTSLDLNYTTLTPTLDLHTVQTLLIDPSLVGKNQVTLVLPQSPTAAELDAAALVSAKLGQLADWRSLSIQSLPIDQLKTQAPLGNAIFIGTAQDLAKIDSTLLPGGNVQMKDLTDQAIATDAGVMWLQISPNESSSIWLTLTGGDETGLQKAARAFATTSAFDRLAGQLGIILDVPEVSSTDSSSATPELSYSLGQLGYTDIVASGSRQQSSYITFPLQLVFDSEGEAVFKIFFSHSTVINPERSSLDVLVNGIPVASTTLNNKNSENSELDVKIPLRLFKLGDNIIAITSNLQLTKSAAASTLYCTDKYYSDLWLTVSPESTLIFPANIGQKTANLTGYPNLYWGNSSLANLAFIVPDSIDWSVATTVVQIANRLGRVADGDQLLNMVVPASQSQAIAAQRPYQILVGLPAQNQAILQLNDLLPQPFAEDNSTPKPIEGVANISPAAGALGYVESLFNKEGQYRLILTGTTSKGLEWVGEALNTPATYKGIKGNLVIASSSTEIATLTIASGTSLVSDEPTSSNTIKPGILNQFPNWMIWLVAGILILSLGALLITRLLRSRK